jgi:hypothetical protein
MDSRLNCFSPYEKSAAWHENQLTRALLVVLRYSPICHQAWLHLIAPDRNLYDLPFAEFATQRQRVLLNDEDIPEGDAVPGISVWLAPAAAEITESVENSDRQQILDGIVTYGSSLVVIIENKITTSAVTEQPHHINLHGSPVVFEKTPRTVSWQQLLGVLSDLLERELVSGSERLLVSDFLEFVEQHFPEIGPYSTLRRCGDNRFRIERRLDNIQGKALKTESGKRQGWRDIAGTKKIFMAYLGLAKDGSEVCLQMYPADTLGQSREFYSDRSSVADLLALQKDNWNVEPNFHWGFMATGYAWLNTPLSVEQYCAYWVREMPRTKELSRSEWEPYWAVLEAAQIVNKAEKTKFDAEFTHTLRQKAHPRPGLCCEYRWPIKVAKALDDSENKFSEAVRDRVNQMLVALRAPQIDVK